MNYFNTRYSFLKKRAVVWQEVVAHLQRSFDLGEAVLDAGSGYGDFIGNVKASRRFAIDMNPEAAAYLPKEVVFRTASLSEMELGLGSAVKTQSLTTVFTSNVLEHMERSDISQFFRSSLALLRPGGRLAILMPNYRRAFREYFDDFTHLTPLSDIALCDWLRAEGFEIEYCHPGFLPYSMKDSRLPVMPFLVRAWLKSPWKPGGKQMLVVGRKPNA